MITMRRSHRPSLARAAYLALLSVLVLCYERRFPVLAKQSSSSLIEIDAKNKSDIFVRKAIEDVMEMARVVEELYETRCDASRLSRCAESNYDHFLSILPGVTCPPPEDTAFRTSECGNHDSCSALLSYATSSVSLPPETNTTVDGNPIEPRVVEAICFTKDLDDYFTAKQEADAEFWNDFAGGGPLQMPFPRYFGSTTGVLRSFPARYDDLERGAFDPRTRPWYVAAASGPKNIIMVLDKSSASSPSSSTDAAANDDDHRVERMKEAAKRVIDTAGIADRIAIVFFAHDTQTITADGGLSFRATDANKQILNAAVDGLQSNGGTTNVTAAFEKAFDILDTTAADDDGELLAPCKTAILFLTHGETDEPVDQVISTVNTRLISSQQKVRNVPIYLFTYSMAGGVQEVDELASKLACLLPDSGIWTRIDSAAEIANSLANYYKFFSLDLRHSETNDKYAAWVEPYRK
jgi:hypothetical protein